MTLPRDAIFDHLDAMSDHHGLFEHARGSTPRREHGYCTDDNARLLVVGSRDCDRPQADALSRAALRFTLASLTTDGRTRNRMTSSGVWSDRGSNEDCWGRSLWGLGVAATRHADPAVRADALAGFTLGAHGRSPWPHANAFAALGAADVLDEHPDHAGAHAVLRAAVETIGVPTSTAWRWPLPRLTYANATIAEALIGAGAALGEPNVTDTGLDMLDWLFDRESRRGYLSVAGSDPPPEPTGEPEFDQQPIEVAAMAEACSRALRVTGESRWSHGVWLAAAWYEGANDTGAAMWDPATGGSFDGLLRRGVNRNQGAESTIAFVSTIQCSRVLEQRVA